jgi:hypothetical protein
MRTFRVLTTFGPRSAMTRVAWTAMIQGTVRRHSWTLVGHMQKPSAGNQAGNQTEGPRTVSAGSVRGSFQVAPARQGRAFSEALAALQLLTVSDVYGLLRISKTDFWLAAVRSRCVAGRASALAEVLERVRNVLFRLLAPGSAGHTRIRVRRLYPWEINNNSPGRSGSAHQCRF